MTELDRKYVLIDINGLSFSNRTFMRRGDVFITYYTTSVATALECVQNKFKTGASYFSRINKETCFVNSVLNLNPHRKFLLWLTPSINKFFSETFNSLYTYYMLIRSFNDVALPVTTTCTLYANFDGTVLVVLYDVQRRILMKFEVFG